MLRYITLTAFVTLSLFSIVLYSGCIKSTTTDKCAGITCSHGTCNSGVCSCYSGYTGTYCDKRTCEANNTAQVRFQNKTGASKTYSVVWDGSTLTTLAPGATSEYYTVAAGTHTLHFMYANTTTEACTQSSPVLAVCSSMEYWCTN
jgi:hypothetical protein